MLVKLLSENDRAHFFKLAELLSIADKPLLWDGKARDEVTAKTDLRKVSFAKGEAETALLADWRREVGVNYVKSAFEVFAGKLDATDIEKSLLGQLEEIPLHKNTEDSAERRQAVGSILQQLLKSAPPTTPHAVRIMLYELMLMAHASGGTSDLERHYLELYRQHHRIDDCDFKELQERAEAMYREIQKTIALILE